MIFFIMYMTTFDFDDTYVKMIGKFWSYFISKRRIRQREFPNSHPLILSKHSDSHSLMRLMLIKECRWEQLILLSSYHYSRVYDIHVIHMCSRKAIERATIITIEERKKKRALERWWTYRIYLTKISMKKNLKSHIYCWFKLTLNITL